MPSARYAEATLIAKDKAVSRFLGYLHEVGADNLALLGVRDVSGFLVHQRGLRRKTIASMRSCLADFLVFSAAAGKTPQGLADRLPPYRHVRHESEPHLWTADEIRRVLAVIDRASATGKRDYAMILATARLGLRISDLRHMELSDLDWRAKQITIVQHKTGRPLRLPLLGDVGWAIIDYIRGGRPETACPKVFVKHRHPFDTFGCASSVAFRLSRHAARAGIAFSPGQVCGMHSLRGALAVAMIGNGAPMPVISAVLGHASSDTTQSYYLRFDADLVAVRHAGGTGSTSRNGCCASSPSTAGGRATRMGRSAKKRSRGSSTALTCGPPRSGATGWRCANWLRTPKASAGPAATTRVRVCHQPPYVFTDDEVRRLFAAIDTQPMSAYSNKALVDPVLFRMLYGAGLRVSEALNLRLSDVDTSAATLHIRDTKNGAGRRIPITGRLTAALQGYTAAAHRAPSTATTCSTAGLRAGRSTRRRYTVLPEVHRRRLPRRDGQSPTPVRLRHPRRTPGAAVSSRPAPPPDLAGRWLAKFFTDHLAGERAASSATVASYRDAMKLLLTWFKDAEHIPPEKLRLADIDRPRVLRLLNWLQAERGCSTATRNQRLAVIKSFCR